MAKEMPIHSKDLIIQLTKRFPDEMDVYEYASPFERGKKAGVVELLRELKHFYLKGDSMTKIEGIQ